MLLATVALARGGRGHAAATIASRLAWLRLVGVLFALAAVTLLLGGDAVVGGFEAFGAVMAVVDTLAALIVTSAAVRRTRHE